MKIWSISEIENIKEKEAKTMAIEKMEIKEHSIYFVDFGNAFGYSCLVFKNNHSIHNANDYELHYNGKTKNELKNIYIEEMNNILFTEAEISDTLKDYEEYKRRSYYLQNYYGMQVDYISIFCCNPTDEQKAEFEEKTKQMVYNPVAYAYMEDAGFVKHHIELFNKLEKVKADMSDNYEYLKNAFLYEMFNHEYGINWQADYDTLSEFGNIKYHDGDLNAYFDELKFTDLQKKAYLDARRQYFTETNL